MKRILLVMSVAAFMAAMVLVTAVPAFSTIHELARVPEDNPDQASPVAGEFPPGLTDADPDVVPGLPEGQQFDQGNGSDNSDQLNSEGPFEGCVDQTTGELLVKPRASCEGNFAQAIVSVGQNPSGDENPPVVDPTPKDLGAGNAFEKCSPSNEDLPDEDEQLARDEACAALNR